MGGETPQAPSGSALVVGGTGDSPGGSGESSPGLVPSTANEFGLLVRVVMIVGGILHRPRVDGTF